MIVNLKRGTLSLASIPLYLTQVQQSVLHQVIQPIWWMAPLAAHI